MRSDVFNLFARGALGVAGAAASVGLASSARVQSLSKKSFDLILFSSFPAVRLLFFVSIFVILKLPPHGDVTGFYYPEALWVLSGRVPYRDFSSSYAPLHGYLNAAIVGIWNSPLALILFAIVVESFLLPIWLLAGRGLVAERTLRGACALYLVNPLSLMFIAADGTNNCLIAVLIACSLLLIVRRRLAMSGFMMGLNLIEVKFTALLYVPILFFASRRRRLWGGVFLLTIAVGYLPFMLLHAPVLQPLREASLRTSGVLPYQVETILGLVLPDRLWDLLLLGSLAVIVGLVGWKTRGDLEPNVFHFAPAAMVAIAFAVQFLSKKSNPAYIAQVLFPLCLLFGKAGRKGLIGLGIFGVAALLELSYWFTMTEQVGPIALHHDLLAHQTVALGFQLIECLLVAGYGWIFWLSLDALAKPEKYFGAVSAGADVTDLPVLSPGGECG